MAELDPPYLPEARAAAEPSSGDWTWRESDNGYFHVDGPLGTLAVVFGESRTPNGGRTGVVGDEGEANARLMSAGPTLLAALRHVGCRSARIYASGNTCAERAAQGEVEVKPCVVCAAIARAEVRRG